MTDVRRGNPSRFLGSLRNPLGGGKGRGRALSACKHYKCRAEDVSLDPSHPVRLAAMLVVLYGYPFNFKGKKYATGHLVASEAGKIKSYPGLLLGSVPGRTPDPNMLGTRPFPTKSGTASDPWREDDEPGKKPCAEWPYVQWEPPKASGAVVRHCVSGRSPQKWSPAVRAGWPNSASTASAKAVATFRRAVCVFTREIDLSMDSSRGRSPRYSA